jgi:hypothetical protein
MANRAGRAGGRGRGPAWRGYEGGSYAPDRPCEPLFDWGDGVLVVPTRLMIRRYARMPARKIPSCAFVSLAGAEAKVEPVARWRRLDRFAQPMVTSTRVEAPTCGPGPL